MIKGGPKIIDDSLVLCLDAHDAKSYAGEPASNLNSDTNDYTGTSYSYFGEWTSNPTRLSKSYDSTIKTPIGTGATLIQESGTNGYHHLSRMGGSETGNHTISFYFKPVTSDINNLKIGMLGDSGSIITFDFTQSPVAVTQTGSAISGKLALLAPLSNGWYFCAADFNGRSGGWIGCVGFNINAEYTGVLGSKKAYICGLNYNTKAYALPSFDRSATDGWVDRSGNSNDGTLVNGTDTGVSHYRDGQVIMPIANSYLDLDGTDDYIQIPQFDFTSTHSLEWWFNTDNLTEKLSGGYAGHMLCWGHTPSERVYLKTDGSIAVFINDSSSGAIFTTSNFSVTAGVWINIAVTFDWLSKNVKFYQNGVLKDTISFSSLGSWNYTGASNPYDYIDFGRNVSNNNIFFDGKVAGIKIYSKILTLTEVLNNYNATKGRFNL
jgi:hypothetical protein